MGKTLVQKIFEKHLKKEPFKGTKVLSLDVVMCHEITTPIAITDLVWRKKDRVFDPSKIKAVIDHVNPPKDTKSAIQSQVLRNWANRHGIKDFFDIGQNGVCHAIFPEKGFIRPGYTVIMGDSHTCTHGAFGAFAAGVGTTDLEVGILKGVCAFKEPKTIRVNITGKRPEKVFAKDVILEITRQLTLNGATDCVVEYRGSVIDEMSMEERMTITNMAIESGGTSGICMPDMTTVDYLWKFIANDYNNDKQIALKEFKKWWSDDDAEYEKILDIDVSSLVPLTTDGYKPDNVHPVKDLADRKIDQVYIGSCTNGRLSDLREAAKMAKGHKLHPDVRGIVAPATTDIYRQAMKEGLLETLMEAGFMVTNATCGACLGMSNGVLAPGEVAASTTNRNFNGRMGKGGMVHLMSPASAVASGIKGHLADPSTIN